MQTSVDIRAGHRGARTETGTTALTAADHGGPWSEVQVLEAATFDVLTDRTGSGDALTGFAIAAGIVLYGEFTAVTLASGKVRLYKGAASNFP